MSNTNNAHLQEMRFDPRPRRAGAARAGRRGGNRRGGFTLMEALLAAVILGVATVAVVGPIMAARQQASNVAGAGDALVLARQLLEEIVAKPFADPDDGNYLLGPEPGESGRPWFDNVDDYHGYTDTTASLQTLDGTTVKVTADDRVRYVRKVTVEYRAGPGGPAVAAGDFAIVRVWVGPQDPDGTLGHQAVELSQLVTRVSLRK